jgi:hypothetical protein
MWFTVFLCILILCNQFEKFSVQFNVDHLIFLPGCAFLFDFIAKFPVQVFCFDNWVARNKNKRKRWWIGNFHCFEHMCLVRVKALFALGRPGAEIIAFKVFSKFYIVGLENPSGETPLVSTLLFKFFGCFPADPPIVEIFIFDISKKCRLQIRKNIKKFLSTF